MAKRFTVYERATEDGLTLDSRIRDLERELAEAQKAIAFLLKLMVVLEKRARDAKCIWPKYLTEWLGRAKAIRTKYEAREHNDTSQS
jgi:phage shock protein A